MLMLDESGNIGLMVSSVDIDIKPGSDPKAINLRSKGNIPVAILSSDTFDAITIDPSTVELEGARVRGLLCHDEDVNSDGLLDLVCQVEIQELGIGAGAIVAVLTAQTFDGVLVTGSDSVKIVH